MADQPDVQSAAGAVIEMPWVLLSNQIQQLNENLNARLTEQKAYLDDHLAQFERRIDERFQHIDERFEALDRRFETIDHRFEVLDRRFEAIDHRFEVLDRRFEAIEQRLAFRVNIWVAVVIAGLTLILGALLAHVRF